MDKNLKGLKPALVWKHFAEICNIPHPSHEEDAIRAYIVKWAEELGLEVLRTYNESFIRLQIYAHYLFYPKI